MPDEENPWLTEYAPSIYTYLRTKERKKRVVKGCSPQLHLRRYMVDWLSIVCEKLSLNATTQHLSIYYLDIFMDCHAIHEEQLQLVALGCLLVAAKLEENDSMIPRTSDLKKFAENAYSPVDIIQMEMSLLEFLNWELIVPTAAHYIEYFMPVATSESETLLGTKQQTWLYCQHFVQYFMELSLQETIFLKFLPSVVASSCIAATRISLSFTPTWPKALRKKTKYNLNQLTQCVDLLIRSMECDERITKKQKEEKLSPDSPSSTASSTDY